MCHTGKNVSSVCGGWRLGRRLQPLLLAAIGCVLFSGVPATIRAAGGEELFAKNCAICHGNDGKAQSNYAKKIGVKDLAASKATDGEIEKQVAEGKTDAEGKVKMPPFKDRLTAEEIKSLIPVVKAFRK